MSSVGNLIVSMKEQWGQPREAIHRGQRCQLSLACRFAAEPTDASTERLPIAIPEDVREFWLTARSAFLFEDQRYGQWGVEVFEPAQALLETSRQMIARPEDFAGSDLVLARFLGDSDLLVIECDVNLNDYRLVTVALPIDRRRDWPVVASSFSSFLERLADAQGDKYWEVRKET
jgi:hypothetical protein